MTTQPAITTPKTAEQAYAAAQARIDTALRDLVVKLQTMHADVTHVHWGHVGDLNAIAAHLEELTQD